MREKQKIDLRGVISDVTMMPCGTCDQPASLNRMAEKSLNYLENNPDPDRDYECRFAIYPSQIPYHIPFFPANRYGYDTISIGDTDLRMLMIWPEMRQMAGAGEATEKELGVVKRADGYVGEDGCAYVNPAASTGVDVDGVWLSSWATGLMICGLCNAAERTGDPEYAARAKKALDSELKLTVSTAGMADFPYNTPYRDGEWLSLGWAEEHMHNYALIIEPLLRYYEVSGDREYLRKAILIGEAFVNCMIDIRQTLEIDPETGVFERHTHTHTRDALLGMAHLACLTGDSRYLRWTRRAYDYIRSVSPGFGWYPETMPENRYSETCVTGDMMGIAYYLAKCGELDCYEEMERTWRNYLRCTQFFVTPDIEATIRFLHPERSAAEMDPVIAELKKLEGGFIAQTTWNDLTQRQFQLAEGHGDKLIYMMGCCPPSGMLGLVYLYRAAAEQRKDGVFINMTVTADTPCAALTSDYTSKDKLTVTARTAGDYYLRVPEWTDYNAARVTLNGADVEPVWDGPQCRYLLVRNVRAGDTIRLRYPLVQFTQTLTQTSSEGEEEYRFRWLGNAVTGVSPKAEYIDLFGSQRGIRE